MFPAASTTLSSSTTATTTTTTATTTHANSNNNGTEKLASPPPCRTEFNGMDQGQSAIRQQLINRAKVKSLRISVAIVLAFIVCWSPYYMMMLNFVFRRNADQTYSDDLQSAIFFFGMSNSLVNPIVYGAFHLWPMRRKERQNGRYVIYIYFIDF